MYSRKTVEDSAVDGSIVWGGRDAELLHRFLTTTSFRRTAGRGSSLESETNDDAICPLVRHCRRSRTRRPTPTVDPTLSHVHHPNRLAGREPGSHPGWAA